MDDLKYEESGFIDRWQYLQHRAGLAGIKAIVDAQSIRFCPRGEADAVFQRDTGFQDAVMWLDRHMVNLPGIEGYFENDNQSQMVE